MSDKRSKTVTDSIKETRLFHTRYFRAINSSLRRKILRILNEEQSSFEELQHKTSLDHVTLKWHMDILEHGFCVEKQINQGIDSLQTHSRGQSYRIFRLTPSLESKPKLNLSQNSLFFMINKK